MAMHFALPQLQGVQVSSVLEGFLVLALAQIPLSLGNSVLATAQLASDYFPEKNITVGKIGLTYGIMNIVAPFLGGVPACHGSGGLAGHYIFGARTGGSVVIHGLLLMIGGLLFGDGFARFLHIFPLSVLGTSLIFEGLALAGLVRDMREAVDLFVALLVAACVIFLPYGYLAGLVTGTITFLILKKSPGGAHCRSERRASRGIPCGESARPGR